MLCVLWAGDATTGVLPFLRESEEGRRDIVVDGLEEPDSPPRPGVLTLRTFEDRGLATGNRLGEVCTAVLLWHLPPKQFMILPAVFLIGPRSRKAVSRTGLGLPVSVLWISRLATVSHGAAHLTLLHGQGRHEQQRFAQRQATQQLPRQ